MPHQPSRRVLFAMVSLALAACHVGTEPITNGTTFVLETINGVRLPAASGSSASAQIVIADTLVFHANEGKASGQFEHRETRVSGPYTGENEFGGSYDWREVFLNMSWYPCPFGAFCSNYSAMPAIGRFGRGTLTITFESGGLYPRTYRRVN
jgi:hypothetical protein